MGIYSLNNTKLSTIDESTIIPEPYEGLTGCLEALIDTETNIHRIFEATITNDIMCAVLENNGEYDRLESLQEASVSGVVASIKKFLMKVWAKIKGIFDSFIKRLDGAVMRDNKKYVEKYAKVVRTKDLSKMKHKCAQVKDSGMKALEAAAGGQGLQDIADDLVRAVSKDKNAAKLENYKSKINDGDFEEYIVKECGLDVDYSKFAKEIHEMCYDDPEEHDGLPGSEVTAIIQKLSAKSTVDDVKKVQAANNKYFQALIAQLDKATSAALKLGKDDKGFKYQYDYSKGDAANTKTGNVHKGANGGDSRVQSAKGDKKWAQENFIANAGVAQRGINIVETVHNKIVSAYLKEMQYGISQARSIFTKAVNYNAKKAKNEGAQFWLDTVEECAFEDTMLLFECDEFDTNYPEYDEINFDL